MYYKRIETNARAKAEYNQMHRDVAKQRMLDVGKQAAAKRRQRKQ
jgi:hypothetical protein